MAIVIDASAMVVALLSRSSEAANLRRRLGADTCHAPHLIDAEVGNVLRRRVVRGDLAPADAEALLHFAAPLIDHRHEMIGALARSAWQLRETVTYYDGLYAALAAALSVRLLTADQRLSRASGLGCDVEPVGAG